MPLHHDFPAAGIHHSFPPYLTEGVSSGMLLNCLAGNKDRKKLTFCVCASASASIWTTAYQVQVCRALRCSVWAFDENCRTSEHRLLGVNSVR